MLSEDLVFMRATGTQHKLLNGTRYIILRYQVNELSGK